MKANGGLLRISLVSSRGTAGTGLKKVLIVTPNWPPISCPDLHRARMSLPYFQEFGWEPLILHVDPDEQEGLRDSSLMLTVPRTTRAWQSQPIRREKTEWFGLTSVGWRSLAAMKRDGADIIDEENVDFVFFSTTLFVVTILGRIWHEQFGTPYAVDYQDPWVDDFYDRAGVTPPGGSFKYQVSRAVGRKLEASVMRRVSRVVCVSPAYADSLRDRYRHLGAQQFTILPFGAPERDFALLRELEVRQNLFDPADGKQHWLYVGAVGSIMATALRLLFFALARERMKDPTSWRAVRLHFAGTSYAPQKKAIETVRPLAQQCGVADLVEETTDRVPYFEALKAMTEAAALLVIGSDSASYSASKLYPYILARKPMLSVLHENSPGAAILRELGAGEIVQFTPEDPHASEALACDALERLRIAALAHLPPKLDWRRFSKYTAREMTRQLCKVFDDALAERCVSVKR